MYPQQQPNKMFYKLSQKSEKLGWFVLGVFALVFIMFGASLNSDESYQEKIDTMTKQQTEQAHQVSLLKSEVKDLEEANKNWSDRTLEVYGKLIAKSYRDTLTMTKAERAKLPDTFSNQQDWVKEQPSSITQAGKRIEQAFEKTFTTAFTLLTKKQDIGYWNDFNNRAAQCIAYGESILMAQDKLAMAEDSDFSYVGVVDGDTYAQFTLMQQYIGTFIAVYGKMGKTQDQTASGLFNAISTARSNYLEQVKHGNIKDVAHECKSYFDMNYSL